MNPQLVCCQARQAGDTAVEVYEEIHYHARRLNGTGYNGITERALDSLLTGNTEEQRRLTERLWSQGDTENIRDLQLIRAVGVEAGHTRYDTANTGVRSESGWVGLSRKE